MSARLLYAQTMGQRTKAAVRKFPILPESVARPAEGEEGESDSQAVVSEGDVPALCARLWLVDGRHGEG